MSSERNGPDQIVNRVEALAMRPVRSAMAREIGPPASGGEGLVIACPTEFRPWFAGLARRLGWDRERSERPERKVELDSMGALTWSLIDGQRTAAEIAGVLAIRYKLERREAEDALARFLRELGRRGLIGLAPCPEAGRAESGSPTSTGRPTGS